MPDRPSMSDAIARHYAPADPQERAEQRQQVRDNVGADMTARVRELADHCDKNPGFIDTLPARDRSAVTSYQAYRANNTNGDHQP